MIYRFFLLTLLLVFSCNERKVSSTIKNDQNKRSTDTLKLIYAKGFKIINEGDIKSIHIETPWPDTEQTYKYSFHKDDLPIKRIVVTSTTHIPALELLGVEHALIGYPGTDYISSEKVRDLVVNGNIRELGRNGDINTEVLLEINPDLVMGYGVEGMSKSFEMIEKIGVPVIYNGDWVEETPLGKAEWIKLFGALFNKEQKADSVFNHIEKEYNYAKTIAKGIKDKPTVLSGALHKDVWYLPAGTSVEGELLKDANVNYLWQDSVGKGSLALSFETVLEKAKTADIWLSPSYFTSYKNMLEANGHYEQFEAFKQQKIFSFSNTIGATGGVLYYELGTARPDLVLKDIIKTCHNELLPDYTTTFFKPLD